MTNIEVDAFLARLADVVRVPQANRGRFFLDLRCHFRNMHELAYAPEVRSVGEIVCEAIQAMLDLNDDARSVIDRGLNKIRIVGDGSTNNEPDRKTDFSKFTATPKLLEFLNAAHEVSLSCKAVSGLPDPNLFTPSPGGEPSDDAGGPINIISGHSPGVFGSGLMPRADYRMTDDQLEMLKGWVEISNLEPHDNMTELRYRRANCRDLFDFFLYALDRIIIRACGRFSIQKNSGKGTMIPALDLLRDAAPRGLLPLGLIPAKVSASTLQRRKAAWAKQVDRRNLDVSKTACPDVNATRRNVHSLKSGARSRP
jgi:hypothetical protein